MKLFLRSEVGTIVSSKLLGGGLKLEVTLVIAIMNNKKEFITRLLISVLALTICLGMDLTAVLSREGDLKDGQSHPNKNISQMVASSKSVNPNKSLNIPLTVVNAQAPKVDNPVKDVNKASILSEEPIVLLLFGVMLFAGGLTVRRKFLNGKN